MMKANYFLIGALTATALAALLAAMLLASCEQAGAPSAAAELGSVTVTVAPEGAPGLPPSFAAAVSPGAARTVVPEINDVIKEIELTFTPGTGKPIPKTMTTVTGTFYLPPETYTLSVKAKGAGDAVIAEGTTPAESVVITAGKTTEAEVTLLPKTDGADGSFAYKVTLPDVTTAFLTLTDPQGGTVQTSQSADVKPIPLTSGVDGKVEKLRPGEYRLAVSFEKGEGEVKFSNEAVYIYPGLESSFERNLSKVTLVKTKGTLNLTLSFGPSTILNGNTGSLSFVKDAPETFTLIIPTEKFEGEFTWNLDGADTGVTANSYTPVSSLKVGTHFVTAGAKFKANEQIYTQLVEFEVE
jgi:hypothetical protein